MNLRNSNNDSTLNSSSNRNSQILDQDILNNLYVPSEETMIHKICKGLSTFAEAIKDVKASDRERMLSIFLDNNHIHELTSDLEDFPEIRSLSLSRNGLQSIHRNIGRCRHLRRLTLDNNELSELPLSFCRLGDLTYLYLEANVFTRWPEPLSSLTTGNLKILDLSRNRLSEIPSSIGNLKSLQWLNLSLNHLVALPDSMGSLERMQCLDISGNNLTALPDSFGNMVELNDFRCQSNALTTLPLTLSNWNKIKLVLLNHNALHNIPGNVLVGWGGSLESLALGNNRLTNLPDEIGFLTRCKALGLVRNQLKSLPTEIGYLVALTSLNVGENDLTSLPQSLAHCSRLVTLHAHSNRLEGLDEQLEPLCKQLRAFYLQQNPIKCLPACWKLYQGILHLDDSHFVEVESRLGDGSTDNAAPRVQSNMIVFPHWKNNESHEGPPKLFDIAGNRLLQVFGSEWISSVCGHSSWIRNGPRQQYRNVNNPTPAATRTGGQSSPYPFHELSVWLPATGVEAPDPMSLSSFQQRGSNSNIQTRAKNTNSLHATGDHGKVLGTDGPVDVCNSPIPGFFSFHVTAFRSLPRLVLKRLGQTRTCTECGTVFLHDPLRILEWAQPASTPYQYMPFQHCLCSKRCQRHIWQRQYQEAFGLAHSSADVILDRTMGFSVTTSAVLQNDESELHNVIRRNSLPLSSLEESDGVPLVSQQEQQQQSISSLAARRRSLSDALISSCNTNIIMRSSLNQSTSMRSSLNQSSSSAIQQPSNGLSTVVEESGEFIQLQRSRSSRSRSRGRGGSTGILIQPEE